VRQIFFLFFSLLVSAVGYAQTDSTYHLPKYDYQIYLPKPAKEIQQLLFEKDCTPINGKISESKKTIIMRDYEPGNKVHIKVTYTDGTDDEFVRSPCYIDPVIL
jgi:hypothetical protein